MDVLPQQFEGSDECDIDALLFTFRVLHTECHVESDEDDENSHFIQSPDLVS